MKELAIKIDDKTLGGMSTALKELKEMVDKAINENQPLTKEDLAEISVVIGETLNVLEKAEKAPSIETAAAPGPSAKVHRLPSAPLPSDSQTASLALSPFARGAALEDLVRHGLRMVLLTHAVSNIAPGDIKNLMHRLHASLEGCGYLVQSMILALEDKERKENAEEIAKLVNEILDKPKFLIST